MLKIKILNLKYLEFVEIQGTRFKNTRPLS